MSVTNLSLWREEQATLFKQQGFPNVQEEDWRYTRLSALEKHAWPLAKTLTIDELDILPHRLKETYCIPLVNGCFVQSLADTLPNGVICQSINEALADTQIRSYLGRALPESRHSLVHLNNAKFTDGLFLKVPAGATLDKALQIIHFVTDSQCLVATRHIIIVEQGSQVECIESFVDGGGHAYLSLAINEVFLEDAAQMHWYKVQCEASDAYHVSGLYCQQSENSHLRHHNIALGGQLARTDVCSDLGESSECELNGLILVNQRQHSDNYTRIVHQQPQGKSTEYYKSIAMQRGRAVFQGRVVVNQLAQKTCSAMNNRNLLLSDDAEIDTKPQLEIYADDVQCSHGVTIGQLDEQSIFYLQSRGIDPQSAKNLLVFAFANEMLDRIAHPALQSFLKDAVLDKLPAIDYLS